MGDDAAPSIEGVAFITNLSDRTLTSIDLATGSEETLKLLDISQYNALALSPSGDTIITAEWSKGISFNDTSTMAMIHRMDCGGRVDCVAWSLDGQHIAAGIYKEVIIINSSIRSIIKKVESHSGAVNTVTFNRTSDKVVSGSMDNTAIVYTVPDLIVLMTLSAHSRYVFSSLFLHNDRAVTGSDSTIRVWNAEGNAVSIIEDHSHWIRSLALSPDGKVLASGDDDSKLCIYDSDTYKVMVSVYCEGEVRSLCFVNNSIIVAGVHKSEMIAVDVQTGKVIKKYEGKYVWPSITTRSRQEPAIIVRCRDVLPSSNVYFLSFVLKLSLPPIII